MCGFWTGRFFVFTAGHVLDCRLVDQDRSNGVRKESGGNLNGGLGSGTKCQAAARARGLDLFAEQLRLGMAQA